MNKEVYPEGRQESKEMFLQISVFRHGPKLATVGEGNELAENFRESVKAGYADLADSQEPLDIHVSSSPIARAMETGEIIHAEANVTRPIISRTTLATPYVKGVEDADNPYAEDYTRMVALQSSLMDHERVRIDEEMPESSPQEREEALRNRIDEKCLEALFDDAKEIDEGKRRFLISYEKIADNLAGRYLGYARHGSLLTSRRNARGEGGHYASLDVSHSFPIMSFLKKYLIFSDGVHASQLSGREFLDLTGGVIPESGHLDLCYNTTDEGTTVTVSGNFSGKPFTGIIDLSSITS